MYRKILANSQRDLINANIVGVGNSLMALDPANPNRNYPAKIEALLSLYGVTINNQAIDGRKTSEMVANAAAIDALIVPGVVNILLVTELRNDWLGNDLDPDVAISDYTGYCSARQSAGWKVIVNDIIATWSPDFKGDATAAGALDLDRQRQYINSVLYRTQSTYCDALVTLSRIPELGNYRANVSPAYTQNATRPDETTYFLDGTHLTDDGNDIVAEKESQTIIGVINKK